MRSRLLKGGGMTREHLVKVVRRERRVGRWTCGADCPGWSDQLGVFNGGKRESVELFTYFPIMPMQAMEGVIDIVVRTSFGAWVWRRHLRDVRSGMSSIGSRITRITEMFGQTVIQVSKTLVSLMKGPGTFSIIEVGNVMQQETSIR